MERGAYFKVSLKCEQKAINDKEVVYQNIEAYVEEPLGEKVEGAIKDLKNTITRRRGEKASHQHYSRREEK